MTKVLLKKKEELEKELQLLLQRSREENAALMNLIEALNHEEMKQKSTETKHKPKHRKP